jgi:hypothetical protein
LRAKPKWISSDDVWFNAYPIGWNLLRLIINKLIAIFPNLKNKLLLSSGHGISITHMEEMFIL